MEKWVRVSNACINKPFPFTIVIQAQPPQLSSYVCQVVCNLPSLSSQSKVWLLLLRNSPNPNQFDECSDWCGFLAGIRAQFCSRKHLPKCFKGSDSSHQAGPRGAFCSNNQTHDYLRGWLMATLWCRPVPMEYAVLDLRNGICSLYFLPYLNVPIPLNKILRSRPVDPTDRWCRRLKQTVLYWLERFAPLEFTAFDGIEQLPLSREKLRRFLHWIDFHDPAFVYYKGRGHQCQKHSKWVIKASLLFLCRQRGLYIEKETPQTTVPRPCDTGHWIILLRIADAGVQLPIHERTYNQANPCTKLSGWSAYKIVAIIKQFSNRFLLKLFLGNNFPWFGDAEWGPHERLAKVNSLLGSNAWRTPLFQQTTHMEQSGRISIWHVT